MIRHRQVQKPHKGGFGRHPLRWAFGRGQARVERDSVASADRGERSLRPAKRERGDWEKSWSRPSLACPREAKPMGGAGDRRLKNPCGHKALLGGAIPETEACRAGLTLRRRRNCQANGRWALPGRKIADAFRKGKPSKGESQERCRCETKPARDSREQAVKRVAKP